MNLCSQKVIVTTPLLKIDFFAKLYASSSLLTILVIKKLDCLCVIMKLCVTGNVHTGVQLYFYKNRLCSIICYVVVRFILDIDHVDILFEKVIDIAVSVVGVFFK